MRNSADFISETLDRPLEVVYRDEHLIAVFKPAGLMVHRGEISSGEEPALLQALRDQVGQFLYPIHRIDRPTAGLVLMATSSSVAAGLGELFMSHRVLKHYQALVRGWMPDLCTIDRPLLHPKYFEEREERAGEEQNAMTHFRCLKRFEAPWASPSFPTSRFSLLEAQPETGRWHQIRRHLNHIGHPVIGDHRHGDHRWNQAFYQQTGIYRMLLTAMRLEFRHPVTQEPISLLVGRGEAFDEALAKLTAVACVDNRSAVEGDQSSPL